MKTLSVQEKEIFAENETEALDFIELNQKKMKTQLELQQESAETASENKYGLSDQYWKDRIGFMHGAKWQAERMYSEEEVKQIIEATLIEYSDFVLADIPQWFEQFKKK